MLKVNNQGTATAASSKLKVFFHANGFPSEYPVPSLAPDASYSLLWTPEVDDFDGVLGDARRGGGQEAVGDARDGDRVVVPARFDRGNHASEGRARSVDRAVAYVTFERRPDHRERVFPSRRRELRIDR